MPGARFGGFPLDGPDGEPFVLVPPISRDVVPKRSKAEVEDKQIKSFVNAWAPTVGVDPTDVKICRIAEEDGDFRVDAGPGEKHDVELTALKFEAWVALGVQLQRAADGLVREVQRDATARGAARGRTFILADLATVSGPPSASVMQTLTADTIEALGGLGASEERQQLATADGYRIDVTAQTSDADPDVQVTWSQAHVGLRAAQGELRHCIEAKDLASRKFVVVCTADAGAAGAIAPLDWAAHALLMRDGFGEPVQTGVTERVWLHRTGSLELAEVPVNYVPRVPRR
jgi:hypothetical protein